MTTLITRLDSTLKLIAVGVIAVFVSCPAFAADGTETSPHWVKGKCQVCHDSATPASGRARLKSERAEQLCEGCHEGRGGARPCRHISDIPAGNLKIPESYAATTHDGKLVCTTCHDLAIQCLSPSQSYSFMNPGFVRDRSSGVRGEQCFQCHDSAGFEHLNPHNMLAGNPPQPTCTLCHASTPTMSDSGWQRVDFNVRRSLNDLCTGCHKVSPHPGNSFSGKPIGWEHLAVPSAEIRENMAAAEQALGLVLPLDPITGEVHCATCHNPHHEDVDNYAVAREPGSAARLRVDEICQACHDL
jgi:predicted CXXCH cytochrome family protein